MNTMTMPGFTAEASLYRTNERYQMIETLVAPADGRMIVPQQECGIHGPDICCCMWGVCQCHRRPDLLWQ